MIHSRHIDVLDAFSRGEQGWLAVRYTSLPPAFLKRRHLLSTIIQIMNV